MKKWMAVFAAVLSAGCGEDAPPAPAGPDFSLSGEAIRDHMRTLSSDQFLGRGPGHVGGELAAEYIAAAFEAAGLQPVNGSFFQAVPMIGYAAVPASVALSFRGPGGSKDVPYLDHLVLNVGDPAATSAAGTAEVVFVGYGVHAPEAAWDDFGDVDVRGKVLMILVNDPPATPEEPELFGAQAMTYYGRWTYKFEEAARRGALAALIVHETEPAGYPWSVVRSSWSGEQFSLPPVAGAPQPAGMVGWVSREVAEAALELGGHSYDDLKAAAGRRGFVAVPTGITATASLQSVSRQVETANVVGLLQGASRPDEVITVTSHYDHFGVGEAVDGDSIYNGAYDNASGTALLLEMARAFAALPERPARSLLFVATAAEERGLLGAQWYVDAPLFPLENTVAEMNVDGANLWGETDDMTILGEDRSELGAFARARAAEMGITLVPDGEPEKGFFFRSDHFPFAKAGIPALYVNHGKQYRGRPEGWGQQISDDFTANRYHAPSDEFSEDFVFDGAVQQGLLTSRILWDIAQSEGWPQWHEGQEFKAARDALLARR